MIRLPAAPYRLFEVVGLEIEYVIVDGDMRPRCLLEDVFRSLNGRSTSDIEYRGVGFSNELAAHVFEVKTLEPLASLVQVEADLLRGLRYFSGVLLDRFGARLLPTGMHPFMRPSDTELWQRSNRAVYEAYSNIFPIRDHGWLNIQASHVNLPFGSEAQTVAMHNALACLMPYLPALAASSPIYEGRPGRAVDNRMEFYKTNQRRFPVITGGVVPEFIKSYADYRRRIYAPIRESLRGLPRAERLQAEWVNSRGAIMRFSRRALELKVLDVQECVKADVAIAAFVRGATKHLVTRIEDGGMTLPDHAMLVRDLDAAIRDGSDACVEASHLRPDEAGRETTDVRRVLRDLIEAADAELSSEEAAYLPLVENRVERGNLSERIVRQVRRTTNRSGSGRIAAIRSVYGELMDCLAANTPWDG